MGGMKHLMEQEEARYQMGLEYCLRVGAIEECEYHPGTYYDGGADVEDAYRLANSEISKGGHGEATAEKRKETTDAIKDAYEDNSGVDSCMQCEKAFSRD
jgi:hypothetical protein